MLFTDQKLCQNKKNDVFQAPAKVVHKLCGQGVEKHVHNILTKPLYNNFNKMHKK